jgi:hypothetical protein
MAIVTTHDCREVQESFARRQLLLECCAEHGDELKSEECLHPRHNGPALLEHVRRCVIE